MVRRYVVVVETNGASQSPPVLMEIIDAYDCTEAAKEVVMETMGRYGADVTGILLCRPAHAGSVTKAATMVRDRMLRAMKPASDAVC